MEPHLIERTEATARSSELKRPQVIRRGEIRIAGVNMAAAWDQPHLILPLWITLAANRPLIDGAANPNLLYGVWHRQSTEADEPPSYLVGVEVDQGFEPPDGLTTLTIPSGRYAALLHCGPFSRVNQSYEAIMDWVQRQGLRFRSPTAPTLEIYDTAQPLCDTFGVLLCEPIH